MNKANLYTMSDYVVLFCQNMGVSITPLKLQKLLYYIQSWHIAKFEKDTLFDTLPEAWVNGPVYRQIYDQYKSSFFKNNNIQTKLNEEGLAKNLKTKQAELNLDEKQLILTNAVLDAYSQLSDERLVLMTHSEEPWNEVRKNLSPIERSDKKLSVDTIYNYFNKKK
jgi:uncharacterized phage-associated protein